MFTKQEYEIIMDKFKSYLHYEFVDRYDLDCKYYLAHFPEINKFVGLPKDFRVPVAHIKELKCAHAAVATAYSGPFHYGVHFCDYYSNKEVEQLAMVRHIVHEFRHIYQYLYWDGFDFNKECASKKWEDRRQEIDAMNIERNVDSNNFNKLYREIYELILKERC
jgi:hypothetical protein